jgi:type IV secretory pathway TraG/TraD family ATPase VirD4
VDTEVATRVARYLGEHEKEEASESISFGAHQMRDGVNLSHQKQTKPVVNASQIMQLKDLEAYLKFPGNFPVSKIDFSYLKLPVQTAVYIEKPPKLIKKEEEMPTEQASSHDEAPSNIVHLNFKTVNYESNKSDHVEELDTLDVKNEREIREKEMKSPLTELPELPM